MPNYSDRDIADLANHVRQRIAMDETYASERQRGYERKKQRQVYEIIVEVVRSFYGRVVHEVVARIQSLLSID